MKTESYEQFWLSNIASAEKTIERGRRVLECISMQDQLQLFSTEAQVIPLPSAVLPKTA